MNSRLQNQLNMVGTCIIVANSPEHQTVWQGEGPAATATDLAALAAAYQSIHAKHALAKSATGGAGDEKSLAEDALENAAYLVARACASHFRKTGDADRRGKVDFTLSHFQKLRDRDLVDQATAVRDIAFAATAEPGAADRGVTPARIATLTAALESFSAILTKPRGQIVNRATLLREVTTDTAVLLEDLRDLDDLIIQYNTTEPGRRFIQAWQNARIIVDAGHGHSTEDDETPSPTPAPAP